MKIESVTCISFPYNTERLYKLKRHLTHNGGVSNYITLQREGFDLKHLGIYGLNPVAEVSVNSVEDYLRQLPKISYGVEHFPGVMYFTLTPSLQEKLRDSHVAEVMKNVIEIAESGLGQDRLPPNVTGVMGSVQYEVKDGEIVIHNMNPYYTHENSVLMEAWLNMSNRLRAFIASGEALYGEDTPGVTLGTHYPVFDAVKAGDYMLAVKTLKKILERGYKMAVVSYRQKDKKT